MQDRIVVSEWPALMTTEVAARYLSIDETAFDQIVVRFRTPVIELEDGSARWRKQDLEKLIRKLPSALADPAAAKPPRRIRLDKDQVDAIADAIAVRLARGADRPEPKLVSVSEAGSILGVGRSSIYRMMEDGRLENRRIGRRTLIQMTSIQAILDGTAG